MTFIQNRKTLWAHLFQMVIVFFILFSSFAEANHPARIKSDSKTIIGIGSGSPVILRETSESLAPAFSFFKDHYLLEKTWQCAIRYYSSELFTNIALSVSSRIYNPFYVLTTIHAP